MQLLKSLLLFTPIFSGIVTAVAVANANPLPFPIPGAMASPQDPQDKIDASLKCHTSGKCKYVVSVALECMDAGDEKAIAKCSCEKLKEGGGKTKECIDCQREASGQSQQVMIDDFNKNCQQFGISYQQISPATCLGLTRGTWAGMAAGMIVAGGIAHGGF